MAKASGSESPDAYVKGLASPHREIVEGLRALVSERLPVSERRSTLGEPRIDRKGQRLLDRYVQGHVDFGFCRGTALNDPTGILEGTGKNFRHVKIRDPRDVRSEALPRLVEHAVVLEGKLTSSR